MPKYGGQIYRHLPIYYYSLCVFVKPDSGEWWRIEDADTGQVLMSRRDRRPNITWISADDDREETANEPSHDGYGRAGCAPTVGTDGQAAYRRPRHGREGCVRRPSARTSGLRSPTVTHGLAGCIRRPSARTGGLRSPTVGTDERAAFVDRQHIKPRIIRALLCDVKLFILRIQTSRCQRHVYLRAHPCLSSMELPRTRESIHGHGAPRRWWLLGFRGWQCLLPRSCCGAL